MSLPATINTKRLQLRRPEMRDLEGYVAYYTGARTDGVGRPKPRYIIVERFMAMVGQWALRGYGRYTITTGQAGFGHVGVMHIDETDPPEITWTLWDAAHEGNGYATEAASAVLDAWQGPALVALIDMDNTASAAVAARLGMTEDPGATPPSYNPKARTFAFEGVAA